MKKLLFAMLLSLVALTACGGGNASSDLSVDDVISAFQDAGLTAENAREMTKDDFGMAPMKSDEAKIVEIGDDMNARIMSYSKQADLEQMKAFYDELGKESAMLFSWTMAKDNILIQMNGDLEEERYNEYKSVLEGL